MFDAVLHLVEVNGYFRYGFGYRCSCGARNIGARFTTRRAALDDCRGHLKIPGVDWMPAWIVAKLDEMTTGPAPGVSNRHAGSVLTWPVVANTSASTAVVSLKLNLKGLWGQSVT